jgi:hypothetical protein
VPMVWFHIMGRAFDRCNGRRPIPAPRYGSTRERTDSRTEDFEGLQLGQCEREPMSLAER